MKSVAIAFLLCALSIGALADEGPPSKAAMLEFLGAHGDQDIYNYACEDASDGRGYICEFDLPPGAAIPHVRVRAVPTRGSWDFTILY